MVTKKVIPIKPLTSWSFSRYSLYSSCPAKVKYKHIMKLTEPQNDAMARGSAIHKLAEDYANGTAKKLDPCLKLFADEFKALKAQKSKFIEEDWAFKKDWSQTTWNDWSGCWLRVKLDAAYINAEHNVLVIVDHKSGKFSDWKKAEYEEQLQLYGLAGLKRFPTVAAVTPRLWYIDHGIIHPEEDLVYERKDEKYLTKLWEAKVKKMMADSTFRPKPSDSACKYCTYKKANGGPCAY